MAEENYYQKAEREALNKLEALLALPIDEDDCMSDGERFNPWDMFPALYGSYCGSFDKCAIEVLTEIFEFSNDKPISKPRRDDLGAEMFREMLCTAHLCDYGTSPRACFPAGRFRELLPAFIEKWKAYSLVQWGGDVTV